MPLSTDEDIARILNETQTIALVGASARPERPSHKVLKFLVDKGYNVYPVNPGLAGQTLLGLTVYTTLSDIPEDIDMVDVFRQSSFLQGIVREVIEVGAKTIWTQLGVVDAAAASIAEQAGIQVVMDRCPAIELPRLQASGFIRGN